MLVLDRWLVGPGLGVVTATVVDQVGRVGRHQGSARPGHEAPHIPLLRGIATEEAVRTQAPEIAGSGNGLGGRLRHLVRVRQQLGRGRLLGQEVGQFVRLPEVGQIQLVGEGGQDIGVPLGEFSRPVVVEGEAALLLGSQARAADGDEFGAVGLNDADASEAGVHGGLDGGVAGEDDAGLVDNDGAGGADLTQGRLDLGEVAVVVRAGVAGVGGEGRERRDRPVLLWHLRLVLVRLLVHHSCLHPRGISLKTERAAGRASLLASGGPCVHPLIVVRIVTL